MNTTDKLKKEKKLKAELRETEAELRAAQELADPLRDKCHAIRDEMRQLLSSEEKALAAVNSSGGTARLSDFMRLAVRPWEYDVPPFRITYAPPRGGGLDPLFLCPIYLSKTGDIVTIDKAFEGDMFVGFTIEADACGDVGAGFGQWRCQKLKGQYRHDPKGYES